MCCFCIIVTYIRVLLSKSSTDVFMTAIWVKEYFLSAVALKLIFYPPINRLSTLIFSLKFSIHSLNGFYRHIFSSCNSGNTFIIILCFKLNLTRKKRYYNFILNPRLYGLRSAKYHRYSKISSLPTKTFAN